MELQQLFLLKLRCLSFTHFIQIKNNYFGGQGMKYTDEEKKIIDEVKKYLRELRLINIEKFSLTFEIEDIPSPQSIKYSDEAPGGFSKPKGEQITSNMLRRDLLIKRVTLFNQELDRFMPLLYLLNAGHRNIIRTYVCSRGYSEMIRTLDESYCISVSTYKREFPKACLELSKYINFNNEPSLEELNNRFFNNIKGE